MAEKRVPGYSLQDDGINTTNTQTANKKTAFYFFNNYLVNLNFSL